MWGFYLANYQECIYSLQASALEMSCLSKSKERPLCSPHKKKLSIQKSNYEQKSSLLYLYHKGIILFLSLTYKRISSIGLKCIWNQDWFILRTMYLKICNELKFNVQGQIDARIRLSSIMLQNNKLISSKNIKSISFVEVK